MDSIYHTFDTFPAAIKFEQLLTELENVLIYQDYTRLKLRMGVKPRLILPANHPRNILGCRMLASWEYIVDGKHTWIPLEPIAVSKSNDIRRG